MLLFLLLLFFALSVSRVILSRYLRNLHPPAFASEKATLLPEAEQTLFIVCSKAITEMGSQRRVALICGNSMFSQI